MPNESLTFNGIRKEWLYIERGRTKPPFAALTRNILTVPGYPGGYLSSTEIRPLKINQPVGFRIEDDQDALNKKDELAEWLVTNEPVSLEFDDEPGRIYYAVVENTIDDFEKMATLRRGTITFICPDPYAYGPERPYTFPSDYGSVTNEGTHEAKPIFELEVLTPVTFAMIQNQNDEYMMIGKPTNVEENEPYEKYELIFHDDGTNLTGWTEATAVNFGVVDGLMGTNGYRLEASSYGTGNRWHGPAIKHSFSETLQDFRMNAYVELYNNQPSGVGRVELYLLDENDAFVASIDERYRIFSIVGLGEARVRDGSDGQFLINEYGDKPGNWNNFSGILRIEREGNVWRAYFAKVGADGKHNTRRYVEWIDSANKYMQRVAKVQVHMAQFDTKPPLQGGVSYINVFKINKQPDATPYMANPGDIITFDHKDEEILLNGENAMSFKDFGASFFELNRGVNELVVHPSDAFNVSMKFRETFK